MSIIEEVAAKIPDWRGRQISITPLSGGLTNSNFKIEVDGMPYFDRVPGASTELLAIDRNNDYHNSKAASEAGVAQRIFYHLTNPSKDPDAPAVVLFTSGSEGAPKGVALTHVNLQANCFQASSLSPSGRRGVGTVSLKL